MPRRGASQLEAIAAAVEVFGADQIVIVGSCALALYARPEAPSDLRPTNDVDCVCVIMPLTKLQTLLAHLSETHVLSPDQEILCRYHIKSSGTIVDVIDLEGRTVGKENPWVRRAADAAQRYTVNHTTSARAVTPPFFLAMKLEAFIGRGQNEMCTDAEDIVTLAVEIEDLVDQVQRAGLEREIAALCRQVCAKFDLFSLEDLVDYHIHPKEDAHRGRVRIALAMLAKGATS